VKLDLLSAAEIEVVESALRAAAHGPFFDDVEFYTLMGIERTQMLQVCAEWPRLTVDEVTLDCAVFNAFNNLRGYPHRLSAELEALIPSGRAALEAVHDRLLQLRA
jgi:hypothetical protein